MRVEGARGASTPMPRILLCEQARRTIQFNLCDAANPLRAVMAHHAGQLPHRLAGWDVLIDVDEPGRADDQKWVEGAGVVEPTQADSACPRAARMSDCVIFRLR